MKQPRGECDDQHQAQKHVKQRWQCFEMQLWVQQRKHAKTKMEKRGKANNFKMLLTKSIFFQGE